MPDDTTNTLKWPSSTLGQCMLGADLDHDEKEQQADSEAKEDEQANAHITIDHSVVRYMAKKGFPAPTTILSLTQSRCNRFSATYEFLAMLKQSKLAQRCGSTATADRQPAALGGPTRALVTCPSK